MTENPYAPDDSNPLNDKDTLYELYWGEKWLSEREIARRFDSSKRNVAYHLDKHGIPRRSMGNPNKDTYLQMRRE